MTSTDNTWLPPRAENPRVSGPDGEPAFKVDNIRCSSGSTIWIAFESVGPRWRQGIFVVTNGELTTNGVTSRAFELWSDTSPEVVEIDVVSTEGTLVVHNIWNSGRGRRMESQSATSGMLIEELPDGSRRYRCNDIGYDPDFTSVVFRVSVQQP